MERKRKKMAVIALTSNGCRTALRLGGLLPPGPGKDIFLKAGAAAGLAAEPPVQLFQESLAELLRRLYGHYDSFVMIMAAGIVFRSFAPYVQHKSVDPAVLVIDEKGRFVISLLSGHLGGANRLTRQIAGLLGATPVITTATDINHKPAFDLIAQANNCAIANLEQLKYISGTLVNGGRVALCCDLPIAGQLPPEIVSCPPEAEVSPLPELVVISNRSEDWPCPRAEHTLRLLPRNLVLGAGCKRNTPPQALAAALQDFLAQNHYAAASLSQIASIDLKMAEPGLVELARQFNLTFVIYTAQELKQVAASLPPEQTSPFVERVTGSPSVAQAAALLAARPQLEQAAALGQAGCSEASRLLIGKTVYPGITLSLAQRPMLIRLEEFY